jgi:uncharacterized protein (DUF1499 family)
MLRIALIVLLVSAASAVLILASLSAMAKRPTNLGATEGRLAACPETPNCVCSQGADAGHAVEPLRFSGDADEAWDRLRHALVMTPRTRIISSTENYLHAECTSAVFRFVDDLECLLDRDAKLIHVRSASRVGRSDLGANRARVEALRAAFEAE